MSTQRKRSFTEKKHTPRDMPPYPYPYYYHPQYEYMPPSYDDPAYTHPGYSQDHSEYIYYPVDEYGQIMGPPTRFPPISNPHNYEPSPYPNYIPRMSPRRSYIPSPRADRALYDDYYHRRQYRPEVPRSYPRSRHETLPPIQRHPFAATRPISPNDRESQRFAVRDLTERSSRLSVLSRQDAIKSIQHYDKLRKSFQE